MYEQGLHGNEIRASRNGGEMSQATKWHSVAVLLLLDILPNTFDDNDDDRCTRTIN